MTRFLNGLPRTSHFVIAKANDPVVALETARRIRENKMGGSGSRWHPDPAEWTEATELLAKLVDRVGEAVAILADLPVATDRKGKPKKRTKPPKPHPRPASAIDRAEEILSQEHVNEIMADVESAYVSVEEYERIAREVEEARQAAEAGGEQAVASTEGPPGD